MKLYVKWIGVFVGVAILQAEPASAAFKRCDSLGSEWEVSSTDLAATGNDYDGAPGGNCNPGEVALEITDSLNFTSVTKCIQVTCAKGTTGVETGICSSRVSGRTQLHCYKKK